MDNFFYNLNKKMADLAERQNLAESAVTERDMGKHNNATTGFKALAKKAGGGEKGNRIAGAQFQKMKKAGQLQEIGDTPAGKAALGSYIKKAHASGDAARSSSSLAPMGSKDETQGRQIVQKRAGGIGQAVDRLTSRKLSEDLQADDGEYYKNADDFFSRFEADHFDQETTSPDGMEIRGYIDGKCVMAWRFKSAKKIGGYGIYDDSSLLSEDNMEESAGNNLRSYVLSAIEVIYQGALAGEEMIDDVADELGDYFTDVRRSGDKTLKQAYSLMRDEGMEAEGDPQLMASIAKKAIDMLNQPGIAEGAFKNIDIERQERAAKARHKGGLNQVPGVQNLKPVTREHPLKNVAKGIKAFVQGKPEPMDEAKAKPDYIDLDHDGDKKETMKKAAADKKRSSGTAFDPDTRKQMKTDREGTGNFDKKKISTGTVYTRRHREDDEEQVTSNEPKRKGRPKGPAKGPERVTAKSYKYKQGRPVKEMEIPLTSRGEYDDEAGMAKDQLHTIVRHARELERALGAGDNLPEWVQEKMGQIKGMMTSVTDYMLSQKERGIEQHTGREGITLEKAPPGAKAERMVKHIKKSLSKDGNLSGKDKAIAYATTWKAHNQGKVEEESTEKRDTHAERAGRKVTKDIEYDEKKKDGIHGKKRGNEDDKAERAGRKVAKDIEYDEKHKKVKETTSGSVATASNAAPKAKGMTFGKGVYEGAVNESYERKLRAVLNEGMNVTVNMNAEGQKSVNVNADGEDAEKLAEILKLAGLGGQSSGCSSCGQSSCGCETVDEAYGDAKASKNNPDWPTDTETTDANDPYLRRFSGGLNGAKSTGQTTVPVIASQIRRQVSMEESVALERSLFKTWKTYKGQ